MSQLASYKECTGCMACVDSCSKGALAFSMAVDGHIYPKFNESLCVKCGLCKKKCPVISKINYQNSPMSEAYAGWSKNRNLRRNSASGGVFSAMAEYVIAKTGIVYGCTMDGFANVHHIRINSVEDIPLLQGSKYAQSNVTGIYKLVLEDLRCGKLVLFSGTGCQVAALYSFLGSQKHDGTLITVDIICGGVPSKLLIDKFRECEPFDVKRIVSFRTKETGWSPTGFVKNLKVEDMDGIIHDYSNKRNLVNTGFSCEMTNRYSCYKCQFAGKHRMSDFTIGDYWGIEEFKDEHFDGISAIIVHNGEANMILSDMSDYLFCEKTDIDKVLKKNFRLEETKDKRYILPERKYMTYLFKHLRYSTLQKIYAFNFGKFSPWVLYKIYRHLASKILR